MKWCKLSCMAMVFLAANAFASDVEKYKYCHAKYQDLNARQMHLERLKNTVDFHEMAFRQYNEFKHENLANFHKKHHQALQRILQQQLQHFKKQQKNYHQDCGKTSHPSSHRLNHEHDEIISPI